MLSARYLDQLDGLIVLAYHRALVKGGVTGYTLNNCQDDYLLAWVALIPQAWEVTPFTRAVLHQYRKHQCDQLMS
jgi:hypothetical protein